MKYYASAEDREVTTKLSTVITWLDQVKNGQFKNLDKPCHKRRAAQAISHIEKLLEIAVADLDDDARNGLLKFVENHSVIMVPADKVKSSKDYVVIETKDLEYLFSRFFADCATCMASVPEIKQCKIKKILQKCGAMAADVPRGECPFQP